MPPLNFYKDQVDYSSYLAYSGGKSSSRFASPFDEDSINGGSNKKLSQPSSTQPLFLNFTADLSPHTGGKKQKVKKSSSYKVNGVNILNRKSIDSSTALERLQKRRENHNSVERKRRDNINATIMEISQLLPNPDSSSKPNKGNILKLAADYIKELKGELRALKNEVRVLKGEEPLEEEVDDVQDFRKRKNTEQESSDESDEENALEEKDKLDLDNEENCSSEQVSREVSSEPSDISNTTRQSQETEVDQVTQESTTDEVKIEPTLQVPALPKATVLGCSKPDQFEQTITAPVPLPEPGSNSNQLLADADSYSPIESPTTFSSYPILGGSKRFRADTYTLPGMTQFASMNTSTLSHMHTFSASALRNAPPISPFGFQLPTHHATPLPAPTSHAHFVNHVPSAQSHQLPSHPHARGPPQMMFREFHGNMNMY